MKRLIQFASLVLLLGLPAAGAISVVHAKQNCTATPCTVTSTTASNFFVIGTDSSTLPTAANVKLGTQTSTKIACEFLSAGVSNICTWVITSVTGAQTSLTCTSCGTINAIVGVELSGVDASYLDVWIPCYSAAGALCQSNNAGTSVGFKFTPGWSNEFIFFMGNCNTSASTVTGTGITLTSAFPNSEPNAQGTITSASAIQITNNCGSTPAGSFLLAIKGAGASQNATANIAYQEYGAVATTGNATVVGTVANVGDTILIHAWCLPSCTITTLTLGATNATCAPGGGSNTNAGEVFICWVLSAGAAGTGQTITFTPGGSPTQWQVFYTDVVPSSSNTMSHDQDASANCQSSCSEGATVSTPSITTTVGYFLDNFVSTLNHANGVTGSWGCNAYTQISGDSAVCQVVSTKNQAAWIKNTTGATTAASTTALVSNDPFQSVMTSFKFSGLTTPSGCSNFIAMMGVGCQ